MGHYRIVGMLLGCGADKNAAMNDGATPVLIATQNKHRQVVEMLVAASADKNAATHDGLTPIMIAGHLGDPMIVWLLV